MNDSGQSRLTMGDILLNAMLRGGDRIAIGDPQQDFTYRELHERACRVAGALVRLGAGPDIPVAIALTNCVEYIVADLAVAYLGAVKVPINEMLSDDERSFIILDSHPAVVITELAHLDRLPRRADGSEIPVLVRVGHTNTAPLLPPGSMTWEEAERLEPAEPRSFARKPEHRALILYTGGTTGRPKGVVHSQTGLALNLLAQVIENGVVPEDRMLLTSPLPHAAGLFVQAALVRGASAVIGYSFSPEEVVRQVVAGATFLFLVPTMIYRLLDYLETIPKQDLSALRTIFYGAAPIAEERLAQGLRLLGPVFEQLYGQSEAPNFITRLSKDDHRVGSPRLRSCGQAAILAQVKIVNDAGTELETGEVGEVIAHTPYTMLRYHDLPDETTKALDGEWLRTGDVGYLDAEGYLYLVDRKKDMIISGGFNVYSFEVEQALANHASVRQVAVLGLPDADWGEAVTAVVVADEHVSEQDILAHAQAHLSSYKRPKRVHFRAELPLTAVGKIDKKRLREEYLTRDVPIALAESRASNRTPG